MGYKASRLRRGLSAVCTPYCVQESLCSSSGSTSAGSPSTELEHLDSDHRLQLQSHHLSLQMVSSCLNLSNNFTPTIQSPTPTRSITSNTLSSDSDPGFAPAERGASMCKGADMAGLRKCSPSFSSQHNLVTLLDQRPYLNSRPVSIHDTCITSTDHGPRTTFGTCTPHLVKGFQTQS